MLSITVPSSITAREGFTSAEHEQTSLVVSIFGDNMQLFISSDFSSNPCVIYYCSSYKPGYKAELFVSGHVNAEQTDVLHHK